MGKSLDININSGPLYQQIQNAGTRFVINYGGAGSGKSHTQAQYEVVQTFKPKERILVIRKVGVTLRDSVIPLIVEQIIPAIGASSLFDFNKTDRELTNRITGSKILFRGLDDPEKIKSIAGITRNWIEEASELAEQDFDQLNLRLRGRDGLQMVLTFNPIDENHWLKRRFFDREDSDVTVLKSTYLDNPYLDNDYKKNLEKYKTFDWNYYSVYALGNWGKIDSGAEFYKAFSPAYHTSVTAYDGDYPIFLSFDENVNPYLTCLVMQVQEKSVQVIDEICLKTPQNTLAYTLNEFSKRYHSHNTGVFIYGDATSRKADTKLEKGHNFYSLIKQGLSKYRPIERVPPSNPSVVMAGLFMNDIFRDRFAGISITIDSKCRNTIEDFKYVKEAQDGTKLKEKVKDPRTGVTYEQYGHTSDALTYFICRHFNNEFIQFQRGPETHKRIALKADSPIEY